MIDAGGYLGNSNLKKLGVEISYTEEQVAEIIKCTEDPVYFIKTYVKIVNVDRGLINFEMWPFQEDMVRTFHDNRFCIAKMPRQVGKTTTTVGYMLWSVLFQDLNVRMFLMLWVISWSGLIFSSLLCFSSPLSMHI